MIILTYSPIGSSVGLIDISEENFYDWHPNACNLGDGRKGTVESELLMLWIHYLNAGVNFNMPHKREGCMMLDSSTISR